MLRSNTDMLNLTLIMFMLSARFLRSDNMSDLPLTGPILKIYHKILISPIKFIAYFFSFLRIKSSISSGFFIPLKTISEFGEPAVFILSLPMPKTLSMIPCSTDMS